MNADICQNHHQGNLESIAAFDSNPNRERLRQMAWDFINDRGQHGATADEIVEHYEMFHNSLAPRVSELKRDGRIIDSGERRKTRSGCFAAVYRTVK